MENRLYYKYNSTKEADDLDDSKPSFHLKLDTLLKNKNFRNIDNSLDEEEPFLDALSEDFFENVVDEVQSLVGDVLTEEVNSNSIIPLPPVPPPIPKGDVIYDNSLKISKQQRDWKSVDPHVKVANEGIAEELKAKGTSFLRKTHRSTTNEKVTKSEQTASNNFQHSLRKVNRPPPACTKSQEQCELNKVFKSRNPVAILTESCSGRHAAFVKNEDTCGGSGTKPGKPMLKDRPLNYQQKELSISSKNGGISQSPCTSFKESPSTINPPNDSVAAKNIVSLGNPTSDGYDTSKTNDIKTYRAPCRSVVNEDTFAKMANKENNLNNIIQATEMQQIQQKDKEDVDSNTRDLQPNGICVPIIEDSEDSEETDIDYKIQVVELKLKQKLKRRKKTNSSGIVNDDSGESEVELQIELTELKQRKKKLLKKKRKTKTNELQSPKESAPVSITQPVKHAETPRPPLAEHVETITEVNKAVGQGQQKCSKEINAVNCKTQSTGENIAKSNTINVTAERKIGKSHSFNTSTTFQQPLQLRMTNNNATSEELMTKLRRRQSNIETGRDEVSKVIESQKSLKVQEKNVDHSGTKIETSADRKPSDNFTLSSTGVNKISSNNAKKSHGFDKVNVEAIVHKKENGKESSDEKVKLRNNSTSTIKETIPADAKIKEKAIIVPPPPPMPACLSISTECNKKAFSSDNSSPEEGNSVLSLSEIDVDSHSNLMREIIAGIQLRSHKTDRRVGSGYRASQDLQSIMANAVMLRNQVMNPDSDDSGNDSSGEEFQWNE